MFGKKNEIVHDFEMMVIFDSKSQSYNVPLFVKNKEVLMRDLLNQFQDPRESKNQLFLNAEDFSIFRIGYYDKGTGTVVLTKQPEHIFNVHDIRALAAPPQNVGQSNVVPLS